MSDIPPQDERASPTYKVAKLAVIILSVLIILAFIALVAGGIAKMSSRPTAGKGAARLVLPEGAHILEMQSQPGRLLLHVQGPAGEEIEIIDIQNGNLVGVVRNR